MYEEPDERSWREKFADRHGGVKKAIPFNEDWYLFPDGARMERSSLGQTLDPPVDQLKRLKLVVKYREQVTRREEERFRELKKQVRVTFDESYCPNEFVMHFNGTEQEALEALEDQEQQVRHWRKRLKEAKDELSRLIKPPTQARRDRELDDLVARRNERFLARVRQSKI